MFTEQVNKQRTADYTIFKKDGSHYALNGLTGDIDKVDTAAAVVIQYALDNTARGKVVIVDDMTIVATITAVDDVILDLTGHRLAKSGDTDFLTVTEKQHFGLVDGEIYLPASYTSKVISLISGAGTTRWNRFDNLEISVADASRTYTAIYCHITGTGSISRNVYRNIDIFECAKGIHFDHDVIGGWQSIEFFRDVFIRCPIVGVEWETDIDSATNHCYFDNVSVQTLAAVTTDGYKNIDGVDNTFIHCIPFDWVANAVTPANIIAGANNNIFIGCNFRRNDIVDAGIDNTFLSEGELDIAHLLEYGSRDLDIYGACVAGENYFLKIYGWDTGGAGARKYLRLNVNVGGHGVISSQGGATVRLADDGVIQLNPDANADVRMFESATTGVNKQLKVSGRDVGDVNTRNVLLQWGDGVNDDGIISTSAGRLEFAPSEDGIIFSAIKADTGDPASPREGQLYINTFDNKIRVYADGAWRDLATW